MVSVCAPAGAAQLRGEPGDMRPPAARFIPGVENEIVLHRPAASQIMQRGQVTHRNRITVLAWSSHSMNLSDKQVTVPYRAWSRSCHETDLLVASELASTSRGSPRILSAAGREGWPATWSRWRALRRFRLYASISWRRERLVAEAKGQPERELSAETTGKHRSRPPGRFACTIPQHPCVLSQSAIPSQVSL